MPVRQRRLSAAIPKRFTSETPPRQLSGCIMQPGITAGRMYPADTTDRTGAGLGLSGLPHTRSARYRPAGHGDDDSRRQYPGGTDGVVTTGRPGSLRTHQRTSRHTAHILPEGRRTADHPHRPEAPTGTGQGTDLSPFPAGTAAPDAGRISRIAGGDADWDSGLCGTGTALLRHDPTHPPDFPGAT